MLQCPFFFHQKTCKSLFKEVKPSPDLHKMIKVLMFDILLPPVYITFCQKLMLKQYSVLKHSYLLSYSSENLKVPNY